MTTEVPKNLSWMTPRETRIYTARMQDPPILYRILADEHGISASRTREIMRRLKVLVAKGGPTPKQLSGQECLAQNEVMSLLKQHPGGMLTSEIAQARKVTPRSTSNILNKLLRAGLVEYDEMITGESGAPPYRWFSL